MSMCVWMCGGGHVRVQVPTEGTHLTGSYIKLEICLLQKMHTSDGRSLMNSFHLISLISLNQICLALQRLVV